MEGCGWIIFVLIAGIFILWLIAKFPVVAIIIDLAVIVPIIISVIGGIIVAIQEKKERQAREAWQKAQEEAHHREEQEELRKQIFLYVNQTLELFESAPKLLITAEEYLDQAEIDFKENAYSPFWNSIENAVKALGQIDESINEISNNAHKYSNLIKKYENIPPKFPLTHQSIEKLAVVGMATAKRMEAIVRTAQRNFQFAMIYEQRKTNQILIAGFTNLADAIDRMTWEITESINTLGNSVDIMTSALSESINTISSKMDDATGKIVQQYKELIKEASETTEQEKRIIKMLDNIQRGRKPLL